MHNNQQSLPKTVVVFHRVVHEVMASRFSCNAPPAVMRTKVERTRNVEKVCNRLIEKAHSEEGSKFIVKKHGMTIDNNGHRVEAFAYEIGRFEVGNTLYVGLVVDMLDGYVNVLLVRSDIYPDCARFFFDIGTKADWAVLKECAKRFSPKSASHRYIIDIRKSQYIATEAIARNQLEQSGVFQQCDLEILQGMTAAKLHLIDLCSVTALWHTFPAQLLPRMIHVIVTRDYDDLDEVQRVFRALDFSISNQALGMYVPSTVINGKKGLDAWRQNARFSYMTYDKSQGIDCLFSILEHTLASNDAQFLEQFPYPPIVVGSSIWSKRPCVEIDMRGMRFSDEELLIGRKYVASLIKTHVQLMEAFSKCWAQSVASQNAVLTPYPNLWFRSFHFAVGTTLFPASQAMMDYLELTRDTDAARLRLRNDRQQRYDEAIKELKSATIESPWLYPSKPSTKVKAVVLLSERKGKYDAFLHKKGGQPILAFTEDSLIRRAGLERQEIDDFISKLRENHLLTDKTYPITFENKQQKRFICINAVGITVTVEDREEGTV